MKNLALAIIQKMKSYSPPLNGRIKYKGELLDFNERTVPDNTITKSLRSLVSTNRLNLYPADYNRLTKKIACYAGVKQPMVLITNGSDQGIDLVFRAFTDNGDRVVIPTPSFAMFDQCSQLAGNRIVKLPYRNSGSSFILPEYIKLDPRQIKLIVICNPNNPTGTIMSINEIMNIARKFHNAIVYVDEAYYEFSRISAVRLINKYPNIVITRTFSKAFGLAGLRLGYLIAHPKHITELSKIRGPYDIGSLASMGALVALKNTRSMEKYIDEIMSRAKPIVEKFFDQNKIKYYHSYGNFILFQTNNASLFCAQMLKWGIRLRPQNKAGINNCVRVTIGTTAQMKKFIKAYEKTLR